MLSTIARAFPWKIPFPLIRLLFPLTLFLSACLLFTIQPMTAKTLLPFFGGTPAVWTVCMLFFQGLLLAGYFYAWTLCRFRSNTTWRVTHLCICLLALLALPLHLTPELTAADPALSILTTLVWQIGFPLLIISSSAPLLQFAYSQTALVKAQDPYFLYGASNAGSLIALLAYPLLIERFWGIAEQFQWWDRAFGVYILLTSVILLFIPFQSTTSKPQTTTRALPWKEKAHWILLSFIPCSLMLGVTLYVSTDIAATPLLWTIPLALYLLSFIITFARSSWINLDWIIRLAPLAIIVAVASLLWGFAMPVWQRMIVHFTCFFCLALLCHGKLVTKRPPAEFLTSFYLCIAIGGVLAGVFNGLIAPRCFNSAYEYPLMLLLSVFCLLKSSTRSQQIGIELRTENPSSALRAPSPHVWGEGKSDSHTSSELKPSSQAWGEGNSDSSVLREWKWTLVVLLFLGFYSVALRRPWHGFIEQSIVVLFFTILYVLLRSHTHKARLIGLMILSILSFPELYYPSPGLLQQQRNFFGIKRVFARSNTHYLINQTTLHGFQVQDAKEKTNGAVSYYQPVVSVIYALTQADHPLHASIIGLGIGTLLCQFHADDQVQFIEIDEQVISTAKNSSLFTYLQDCPARANIIKQDGRASVLGFPNHSQNLIIMDAFSSDAIPIHLVTLEAFKLYQEKITPNGVILINMSNRHLNIAPIITAAAHRLDLIMLTQVSPAINELGQLPSRWALLTGDEQVAARLMQSGWRFVTDQSSQLWTDDYSNIIPLLTFAR